MKTFFSLVNRNTVLFLSLVLFSFWAQALVFIDVGRFHWLPHQKGLRIFVFDVHAQRIQEVRYFLDTVSEKRQNSHLVWRYEDVCDIFSDGRVVLQSTFRPEAHKVRTYHRLEDVTGKVCDAKMSQNAIPSLNGQELEHFFLTTSEGKGTQKSSSFCIIYRQALRGESRTLSELCPESAVARSQERGILGELVTELTFLTFGYESLTCQNKSNKGLDGAFFAPHTACLFLTESKCRQEAKTAQNYMKTELSESRIQEKLMALPQDSDVRRRIENFFTECPDRVFKLVQRVRPNGTVQSAISPFQRLQENRIEDRRFWGEVKQRLMEKPQHFFQELAVLLKSFPHLIEEYASMFVSCK